MYSVEYASNEGSSEPGLMQRLIRAFAASYAISTNKRTLGPWIAHLSPGT